ncbi:TonB-dependent receptor [Thermomonas sp.]
MIKPLVAAISTILLTSAFVGNVQAQDATKAKEKDATDLDKVITTGTRTPKSIEKIPGAITVVSQAEVAHTEAITEDATAVLARTVPGYAESSQAMSNSGENLRGRIALRLFDGVPQGSPLREGTRNGTFTDMGVIDHIEVINGPSASEGIGAAGGIINYLSKTPTKEGNEFTLNTRYSTQFKDDSEGWKVGMTFANKSANHDVLLAASRIDRGIAYDGNGRRVGMNTSGSVSDSVANNIFLKGGINFGVDGVQRLEGTVSMFKIKGNGDYIQVEGCRYDPVECPVPSTNTSERGHIAGSLAEFNDFKQYQVNYSHADFFGGQLMVNAYKADQAMRYLPEDDDAKQLTKPVDESKRIFDQSEIGAKKQGLRTSWTRSELFGAEGLELRIGLDLVKDEAQQRLALTNRIWVPPMNYKSTAPWMQMSWDIGPVTLSGGARRQDDKLHVDTYTTTAYRNSVVVQGGGVKYKEDLVNFGAIWRIGGGWSVFGSYGEGFGLPNIGIPLRNISVPGQSVDRIADIAAIVVTNKEFGFNWRGDRGAFGGSYYDSQTDFGASLAIDPVTNDFILTRAPNRIKGFELTGEWRLNDALRATALYSHMKGMTAFWADAPNGSYKAGGLNKPMGVLDLNPDKLGASVSWKFLPGADVTLGATKLFSRDLSGSDTRAFDKRVFKYEESTVGHTLFDLSMNYQTDRYGRFTLGVENLLDKQYILSWSQVPGFQNYWAGRGRMVSISHTITF